MLIIWFPILLWHLRSVFPFSVSMYWSDCVSMRLAVTCVFRACFCFRITGRLNRKLYDTLARKWHRRRKTRTQPLQHLYLLPTAECRGRAGPGTWLHLPWTLRASTFRDDVSAILWLGSSLASLCVSSSFSFIKSITKEKWIVCLLVMFKYW